MDHPTSNKKLKTIHIWQLIFIFTNLDKKIDIDNYCYVAEKWQISIPVNHFVRYYLLEIMMFINPKKFI